MTGLETKVLIIVHFVAPPHPGYWMAWLLVSKTSIYIIYIIVLKTSISSQMHFPGIWSRTVSKKGITFCTSSTEPESHEQGLQKYCGIRALFVQPGQTQSYDRWPGRSRRNFIRNSPILEHIAKTLWASVGSRYILCWFGGFQVTSTILKNSDTGFEHPFPTALSSSLKLLHCLRSVFQINHWMSSSCHKRL